MIAIKAFFEDIDSGIMISINLRATKRTGNGTISEREFTDTVATACTGLQGWIPVLYSDKGLSVGETEMFHFAQK